MYNIEVIRQTSVSYIEVIRQTSVSNKEIIRQTSVSYIEVIITPLLVGRVILFPMLITGFFQGFMKM